MAQVTVLAHARAFEEFFEAERRRLFGAVYLMTGDVGEAEEILQDAFLAVWERWDRVREMEHADGYLFRTAMNGFRSRRRRLARMTRELLLPSQTSEDPYERADLHDEVVRALRELASRQRRFVLPTLAIWIGIAVVGLTAMTIARLRARPGASGAHERRTGASPGPGHGPATGTRAGTEEGGTTMDSKARQEIGIPSARLPEVHSDQMRLRRVNHWLTLAVVVLAVGLTATGVGLIAQSGEEPASRATIGPATEVAQGSATAEVVAVLDANFAAMNAGDREALADAYNRDAVVTDAIAGEFKGVDEIVGFYIEAPGYWQLERVSDVVQVGDFSAFAFTYFGGSGILVYQLDGDLKIVHQWIMGT